MDAQAGFFFDLAPDTFLEGLPQFEDAAGASQWPLSRRRMARIRWSASMTTPATLTECLGASPMTLVPAVEAAKLKVQGLTPHKLRHTAASLAIAVGADVKVIQLMLGHADASMTLNVYGHLWPDRLDEVADVLDIRRTAALEDEDRAA